MAGIGNTDYADWLIEPPYAVSGSDVILLYLSKYRSRWDEADLHGLRPGCAPSRDSGYDGLASRRFLDEPCPVTKLPVICDQYLEQISTKLRHNYRKARHDLERAGGEVLESADQQGWSERLDYLYTLHQSYWAARGRPGAFGAPEVREFFREATGKFAARGWLRLFALRIGLKIAGVLYAITYKSRAYYYQSGVDPGLRNLSIGTLLIGHAVEHAIGEGLSEFDFLRGWEPYKYRWGAQDRETFRLVLWH
jgi:ribosomal protein S18 acetylase RimI-like enzyme